jgi:uncharacterized membrane protein
MSMAALIATVGLMAGLPIAIVGAMAFSPDLGRLNAMAFALLMRGRGLFWRGTGSLAAGMVVVIALSYIGTVILVSVGATDDALSGIPDRLSDFVSVLDGFTIMAAIAAGVVAMVVFVADHGRAAVGVGVSITTIPAAAYVGIALASGAGTEAGNAGIVLAVNILCVVGAEVITGATLRKYLDLRSAHAWIPCPWQEPFSDERVGRRPTSGPTCRRNDKADGRRRTATGRSCGGRASVARREELEPTSL